MKMSERDIKKLAIMLGHLSAEAYPNTKVSTTAVITAVVDWIRTQYRDFKVEPFLADVGAERDILLRSRRKDAAKEAGGGI